ncbi:EamA family transporter [Actinocrinis sp.]|uniref:EamA family transporter n=1 Tax=Actinocrinis sp. TaxID=1920516 RepID=UPI002D504D98|nr:EamA family transporter [Actinocrinis sp.]HZP52013.1 EamA family transporter [Actinocrinis sp.]
MDRTSGDTAGAAPLDSPGLSGTGLDKAGLSSAGPNSAGPNSALLSKTSVGVLLGVTSSVSFGASGPFAKALIDAGFSPLQAVWLRIVGAVLILIACSAALRRRGLIAMLRRNSALVTVYGLVAVAGCQAAYFVAASRLPVGVAILLEFTGPVLVVGWVRLVRRWPVPRVSLVGVAVAMAGLVCVVQIWSGVHLDPVGLAAGLGAGTGNATFFLLIDRLTGSVDPLALNLGGMIVAAVALAPLATPWSTPWGVLTRDVPLGHSSAAPGWLLAASVVLVSTSVAYLTGTAAVQRLSAPVAAGLAYIEPTSAAVIAWVALGERLNPVQILGGSVVLFGAFLAQRGIAAGRATDGAAAAAAEAPGDAVASTVFEPALTP